MDTPGGASLEGGAPVAVLQPISDYYTYSCIYEFSRIFLSLVLIPYHRVIPSQRKREAERRKEYELRDMLREGLDRMYLHNLGGTPDETYMWIKSEPLDDWAINQLSQQLTPLPQYDIEDAVQTPCDCNVCTHGFNHYGF